MTDTQAAPAEETATTIQTEETVVQTQANEESATQTVDTTENEHKKDDGVQKRINKITADKWSEKRRADGLQKELNDLKAKPVQTVQQTTEPVMPKEADYEYDSDEYNKAVAKYHADVATHATNKVLTDNASKTAQDTEAARRQRVQDEFWQKAEKANIEGFNEALGTLPTFEPQVLEALMQSENSPEVSMYLSKHLDVADTIANSSPVVAAMKIGEISTRLAGTKTKNNISNAPDPVETINQSGASTAAKDSPLLEGATFE